MVSRSLRVVSVVLASAAVGCSATSEGAERAPVLEPTFVRAEGDHLAAEFASASVADLVPPAAPGQPWVVGGSVFDPDVGESTAAVWTSADVDGWQRTDVAPADPTVSESIAGVVDHAGGRLAVGAVGSGSDADAAVWRQAADGWQRVDLPIMGGDGAQVASRVVSDGTRVLVVGFENVGGSGRPRLWLSPDGVEWRSVDGDEGGVFDAEGDEAVVDVAIGDDGFIAVGYRDGEARSDGLAWVSADGEAWTPVDLQAPADVAHWSLTSVAVGPGGLVAGGSVTRPGAGSAPMVWRSTDGGSWTGPHQLPRFDDGRTARAGIAVERVAASGEGWLATGGDWTPHVWQSPDGASWSLLPNPTQGRFPEGVRLVDAAQTADGILALGDTPAVLRLVGEGWQVREGGTFPNGGAVPSAASVATDGEQVVVGGGRHAPATSARHASHTGATWSRTAEGTWRRRTTGLDAGSVASVAHTDAGFLAVGVEQRAGAVRRGGDNYGPDGLVWVQADDRWQRLGAQPLPPEGDDGPFRGAEPPSAPPVGGPGNNYLEDVIPLGRGWLAAGGTYADDADGTWQGDGLVVVSPDGTAWVAEDAATGGPDDQQLTGACGAPDASVVAVGTTTDRVAQAALVRHRSPQGVWTTGSPEDGDAFADQNHAMLACAAGDDGYVVVGHVEHGDEVDAAVWTSSDGVTWSRLDHERLGGEGDQWASAVVAVPGGGWLAGGGDSAGGDDDAALWRIGPDGEVSRRDRGETELGGRGDQRVNDLAVVGDGVVAVGDDHTRIGVWESPVIDR